MIVIELTEDQLDYIKACINFVSDGHLVEIESYLDEDLEIDPWDINEQLNSIL